ncbi:MAG: O-methyltransferase [Candidatus Sericytochromatia bacterium]
MKFVAEEINQYCEAHSYPVSELLQTLAAKTRADVPGAIMLVGTLEGRLLRLLVRLSQARRVLEIGTFTGYSALSMAEALPDDGELISCDINAETTQLAQETWNQSPHGPKIKLKLGPALETIAGLSGSFDMVFVDADKTNYSNYWQACVPKLRPGGLIVVDNVLWSGRALDPKEESDHAIAALNELASRDDRVETVMLPVRDGMLLGWKK